MTITIFWYKKDHETIELKPNQKLHIVRNTITIYHWSRKLDKPVTDRKLKYDIFLDAIIVD